MLSNLGARGFLPSFVREVLTFSNSLSPQSPSNRPEHSLIKPLRLLEMRAEGLQTHKKPLLHEYVEQNYFAHIHIWPVFKCEQMGL